MTWTTVVGCPTFKISFTNVFFLSSSFFLFLDANGEKKEFLSAIVQKGKITLAFY